MSGITYVYAVTLADATLPLATLGLHDRPLERIECGDLAVVTSSGMECSIPPTKENALRHHDVVTALCAGGPVLPVRFGTTFSDHQAVVTAIREMHPQLMSSIQRLVGTTEFGLTSLWPDTPKEEPPHDSAKPHQADRPTSGFDYMHNRLGEYRRQERLRQRAHDIAIMLSTHFDDLFLDKVEQLLPSPDIPVRASYLVAEDRAPEFKEAFDDIRMSVSDVRLVLTGPWPPYSFTTGEDEGLQSLARDMTGRPITRSSNGSSTA